MTSCEGAQRKLRPQSIELWQDAIAKVGLVPGRLHGVDIVHNMMIGFPIGFGLRVEKSSIHLTWHNKPCLTSLPGCLNTLRLQCPIVLSSAGKA